MVGSRWPVWKGYNQLLDDGDQPQVPQHHLQNLASIFTRYNTESMFALHLVYGHLKIQRDMNKLRQAVRVLEETGEYSTH